VLTEAAGVRENINIQVPEFELSHGDRLLICSDGIHGVIEDGVLGKALSAGLDAETTTRYLVSRAKREGGPDNISCIVIDYNQGS
jgi:protein phosphatase